VLLANDPASWPDGVARHVLAEVDSTNAEAARLAPQLTQPTWIMARRQTAARGRRGRAWANPEGNFSATLLMRPDGSPAQAALRSFIAALALADALALICGPGATISLKWPNDVLLNGGKVAGILLESAGQGGQLSHLIIGIGVNLTTSPAPDTVEAGAVQPVSVQGECGVDVTQDALLDYLAHAFAHWEAEFQIYGFALIRNAWMARAAKLGQEITARTMTETISGTFDSLADDGSLILRTSDGRRAIPAADVFF
jgi:BirA family transcriptional regulator, biotin operon repressor / biotin---[acetyl-CoA-carboxylase] ligase